MACRAPKWDVFRQTITGIWQRSACPLPCDVQQLTLVIPQGCCGNPRTEVVYEVFEWFAHNRPNHTHLVKIDWDVSAGRGGGRGMSMVCMRMSSSMEAYSGGLFATA